MAQAEAVDTPVDLTLPSPLSPEEQRRLSLMALARSLELKPRMIRFAHLYAVSGDYRAAYLGAGYKVTPMIASMRGCALARTSKVRQYLQAFQDSALEKALADEDRIVGETVKVAFSDVRKLFNPETGALIEPHKLDDATARAVSSVQITERTVGQQIVKTTKIKFWNKTDALDKLFRWQGLYKDSQPTTGPKTTKVELVYGAPVEDGAPPTLGARVTVTEGGPE